MASLYAEWGTNSHTPDDDLFLLETAMRRVTITLDDDLMAELDRYIATRGYQNRSEAIRDLARTGIMEAAEKANETGNCVAAVVYVYDHEARELPKRLTQTYHSHHDLALATFHVHLDEESCMEVTMLKGQSGEVRHFAEHVIAERGVRHGHIVLVPIPGSNAKAKRAGHHAPRASFRHTRRAGRTER